MAENFLQLSQDKTEVLVIGPEAQREKLNSKLQELLLKPVNKWKTFEWPLIRILILNHILEV